MLSRLSALARIALLAAGIAAVLAANHWRQWWAPESQRYMLADPCPADPAADRFAGSGDPDALCGYRADNQRRIAAGQRPDLVLFGDSILANWQADQPGLFGQDWVNRGVAGQDSAQLLARFRQDVIALRPRVVLIEGGANDIIARRRVTRPQDLIANLESLVDLAQANQITVIIATMPPIAHWPTRPRRSPHPLVEQVNQQIREFAQRRGLVLADFHAALAGPDGRDPAPGLSRDGVHPTAAGYARLEPVVRRALNQTRQEKP